MQWDRSLFEPFAHAGEPGSKNCRPPGCRRRKPLRQLVECVSNDPLATSD
jgi:hypothetical protein